MATGFTRSLPNSPKSEVFAKSEREFFLKLIDAQLTFDADAQRLRPRSPFIRTEGTSSPSE